MLLYICTSLALSAQDFPWYPKPVNELTGSTAPELNEFPCLVLFTGCVLMAFLPCIVFLHSLCANDIHC